MRRFDLLLLLVLPACGNVNHPEYHPVTSVQYTQTVGYPVSASGQPMMAGPPPPWLAPPAPVAIPSPPPPDMGW